MIAPSTDIILYKSNLELDNFNQLKFDRWEDQWAYFSNLPHIYLDNATYQRKEGVIRFPTQDISFDELIRYNYVSYKNEAYANKTFFAYVKNMKYVNDGMTEIEIETDVFQTWQFDIIYRKCFVEREHVNNDLIGLHTVPEGLETGSYICYDEPYELNYFDAGGIGLTTHCLCMGITGSRGQLVNNQYTGLCYVFFKDTTNEGEAWAIMNRYIDTVLAGGDEVIQFIMPVDLSWIQNYVDWTYEIGSSGLHYGLLKSGQGSLKYVALDLGTYIKQWDNALGGGYVPRNNKLLCYPYRYLMLTNNNGGNMIYRFEDTVDKDRIGIQVYGALVPGMSIYAVPVYYKGVDENFSEGLIGAKIPLASWNSDMYTNWLVQNGVNEELAYTTTAEDAKMAYNINQVPVVGPLMNKYAGVINSMAEIYQHSVVPYGSRGNINGGDVNFSLGNCNMKLYDFVIKREYAKMIDDYFTMYGYKVNSLKIPEIHSRVNWNFIKTIDCNFSGDIPGDDLIKIRNLFNTGITIWHNPSTFLDYSQSNNII